MTPTSSRSAKERVEFALMMIEDAQRLINQAAQELCDVRGMCPEWEASGRVYEQVKAYWNRVNSKRFQLTRDGKQLQLGDADPASLTAGCSDA